jgi:hypothetical protein
MNTIQDFTAKLDNLNWTKYDFETNTLISDEGYKLSYSVDLHSTPSLRIPIFQVVIRLRYKKSHVMTWGCDSHDNQDFFGKWFASNKQIAIDLEYERERIEKGNAQDFFFNL